MTIAAISSTIAPGARIIVRLSGTDSHRIAQSLCDIQKLQPASAQRVSLVFNDLQCPAWIYAFAAPASYTGEDLIEFHIPGSVVLAKLLLDELYRLGAKAAEPGEFTARAFFNGKIGLTEAEGVAATIAAGNDAELLAARQLLAGELARRLAPITDSIAQTLALIEVGIDFSEEEVTFLAADQVARRITDADLALEELLTQSSRFEQLRHEPVMVLVGRPNAGKSSLINALTHQARAVVSDIAGTTRDVLIAPLDLARGRIMLCDIAGLEVTTLDVTGSDVANAAIASGQADPHSQIERSMQVHARRAIGAADHLLLVMDQSDPRPPLQLPRPPALTILTKSDLPKPAVTRSGLLVSSRTKTGLDQLRGALDELAFSQSQTAFTIALNRRHLQAIHTARQALTRASARVVDSAPELVAMDLREVLDCLGSIVGQVTPDDVLGKIFSTFCIGK